MYRYVVGISDCSTLVLESIFQGPNLLQLITVGMQGDTGYACRSVTPMRLFRDVEIKIINRPNDLARSSPLSDRDYAGKLKTCELDARFIVFAQQPLCVTVAPVASP